MFILNLLAIVLSRNDVFLGVMMEDSDIVLDEPFAGSRCSHGIWLDDKDFAAWAFFAPATDTG